MFVSLIMIALFIVCTRGPIELMDDSPFSMLKSLLAECFKIGLYSDILSSLYRVTILNFSFLLPLLFLLIFWLNLYWLLLLALFGQSNYFLIFSILEKSVSMDEDRLVYKWDYIIVPKGNLFYLLGVFKGDDIARFAIGFSAAMYVWEDFNYWPLYFLLLFYV